jgi:hypothetical protein
LAPPVDSGHHRRQSDAAERGEDRRIDSAINLEPGDRISPGDKLPHQFIKRPLAKGMKTTRETAQARGIDTGFPLRILAGSGNFQV